MEKKSNIICPKTGKKTYAHKPPVAIYVAAPVLVLNHFKAAAALRKKPEPVIPLAIRSNAFKAAAWLIKQRKK